MKATPVGHRWDQPAWLGSHDLQPRFVALTTTTASTPVSTSQTHPTGRLHWSWPLFNIYHRVSAGACEEQPEQWAEDTHICWGTLWTKEQQCVQYSSLQGLVRAHAVHSAPLSKHADTWHDMNDSVTYRKPIIWSTSNEALALLKPAAEFFLFCFYKSAFLRLCPAPNAPEKHSQTELWGRLSRSNNVDCDR